MQRVWCAGGMSSDPSAACCWRRGRKNSLSPISYFLEYLHSSIIRMPEPFSGTCSMVCSSSLNMWLWDGCRSMSSWEKIWFSCTLQDSQVPSIPVAGCISGMKLLLQSTQQTPRRSHTRFFRSLQCDYSVYLHWQ